MRLRFATRAFLLAALVLTGCGDDTDTTSSAGQEGGGGEPIVDVPAVEDVAWALGWWRAPDEETTAHEGLILRHIELREDGIAIQEISHCLTENERYEGRWVPAASDRVYLLGPTDEDEVQWMSGGGLIRIELEYDAEEESVHVLRIAENADGSERPLPAETFVRGRKCMTDVVVSDCATRMCEEGE